MGTSFIDYVLVDDFIVPAGQQPFFTEKLVHLPGCYQVNDSQREISAHTPSRAECGLPDAGFVFCCFNNGYKITPNVFDVWMRLLRSLPESVLWLLEGNRRQRPNCAARRNREASPPNGSCSRRDFRRQSIWHGTVWPTCFSTRSRSMPTRRPATHSGPVARC